MTWKVYAAGRAGGCLPTVFAEDLETCRSRWQLASQKGRTPGVRSLRTQYGYVTGLWAWRRCFFLLPIALGASRKVSLVWNEVLGVIGLSSAGLDGLDEPARDLDLGEGAIAPNDEAITLLPKDFTLQLSTPFESNGCDAIDSD